MVKFLNGTGLERLVALIKQALSGKQDTLVSGTNIKTVNNTSLLGSGNVAVQAPLTFDTAPTASSANPVTSGGVKTALDAKQDENFVVAITKSGSVYSADKTFANTYAAYNAGKNVICTAPTDFGTSVGSVSLVGIDIVVFSIPWDDGDDAYIDVYYLYEDNSVNFASKKVQKKLTFDASPMSGSSNPVYSRGIKTALDAKQDTLESGTNIKTVNNTSLLGSGNVSLNANNILMTDDDPNGDWAEGDTIEEALIAKSNAFNSLQPNEIASITTSESSASGGNNTVTIAETNGTSHTFNVKNGTNGKSAYQCYYDTTSDSPKKTEAEWLASLRGNDGVSLGQVAIADDLLTDDATKVLSAKQGKGLGDDVKRLKEYELGEKTYDEDDLFKNKSYSNSINPVAKYKNNLANYGCLKIAVEKGDKLIVSTYGASGARAYSLCDNDYVPYVVAASGLDTTSNPVTLDVTKDGYFYANCKSANYEDFYVTHYYSQEKHQLNDNTKSLTNGEIKGTSTWVRDRMETVGWEFSIVTTSSGGTSNGSEDYCITPYIELPYSVAGHSLTFHYGFNSISLYICFYNSSKVFTSGHYVITNSNNEKTETINSGWTSDTYVRVLCNANKISECFIYDNTTEEYLWRGDDDLVEISKSALVSYDTFANVLMTQETGSNEKLVMSQKAITEQVQRVTAGDLGGTSDWMKAKLTSLGWQLGKYLYTNVVQTNSAYCITPMIPISNIIGHSLTWDIGVATNQIKLWFCKENGARTGYWDGGTSSSSTRTITVTSSGTSSAADATHLMISLSINNIPKCYIYDNTVGEYIFKGDDYLEAICNNLLVDYNVFHNTLMSQEVGDSSDITMSQKAITDAITHSRSLTPCQCAFVKGNTYFNLSDAQCAALNNTGIISIVFTRLSAWNPSYPTEWRYFRLRGASAGNTTDGFYIGCASHGRMYYQTYANNANNQARADAANIYNYNNNSANKICPAVSVVVWDRINGIVKFYDRTTLITTKQDDAYKLTGFVSSNKNIYMFPGDDQSFLYDLQIYNYDIMGIVDTYINQLEGANYIHDCYDGNFRDALVDWGSGGYSTYGNSTAIPYTYDGNTVIMTSTSSCVANSTTTQRGYYVGTTDVARLYESDIEVVSGECKINNRTPNVIEKIVNRDTGDVYSAGDTLGVGKYTICGRAMVVACWSLTYMSGDPMVVKHTANRQKYISCVMHLKCDTLYNGELYDDQADVFYSAGVSPSNTTFKYIRQSTSAAPNFAGQMAVSGNNIYVGSKVYTWKQINNS